MDDARRLTVFYEFGTGELGVQRLGWDTSGHRVDESPPGDNPVFDFVFSFVYRLFLLPDELASYRRLSQQVQELAGKPFYEAKPLWKNLQDQFRSRAGPVSNFFGLPLNLASGVAHTDARRQTARLGVAAYCYRAKHGRFPEKLDDLVPDFIPFVRVDPFDGKPMRMKRTEHGLVIYSIGPDMVDDGGTPWTWGKPDAGSDITFELTDKKP
jgi:hypothetical protein